ncbi:MAG: efflux RND transporter permease subunit [Planctomycetota bacterium]
MFSQFIHRPVLAIVTSVALVFLGMLALKALPNSQFPSISPPRVHVEIAYPGASADVLVKSTLIPLERSINGVPGMRYLISDATSAGEATLQIVFEPGTNASANVVNVKNRVDQVMNRLPPLVQREGVVINRMQPSMLMYVNLYSDDKGATEKFVYNYAKVYLLPELKRIPGMGRASILGTRQYAMRLWLKPDRMRAYNVSTEEVLEAVQEQSVIGRPGRTGRSSGKKSQSLEYVLVYEGRFNTPEKYGNIIIRATPEGRFLRLKDVADVELDSEFYDIYSNLDGKPSAAIVLKQNLGSNATKVIEAVKDKLNELERNFPPGMKYSVSYDVSKFLDASIEKVLHTLFEAFVLVAAVVFIFLGDWRSTLIPTLAVPVSLIGAFVFMLAFGFTINLITLFALVLAIGIVVDNAIVVVEAVHAKMEHEHVSPYNAVKQVLGEISGAVIAITVMMAAVFVPVAFMTGPVGVFYRQFSVTMATSIVLSGVVALTLTPVLCAMLLRPVHGVPRKGLISRVFGGFLDVFNKVFEKVTDWYVALLRLIVPRRVLTIAMLLVTCGGVYLVNEVLPSGFIPNEDQGIIYGIIQTPPGSTLERTNAVSRQLQAIAEELPEVHSVSSLAGFEILTEGRGSNAGTCLINLKNWSERHRSVEEVIEELEEKSKGIGATVEFFLPPAVPGFGQAGGISFRLLEKTSTVGYHEFEGVVNKFMKELSKRKELTGLFTFYAANYPQYELVVNNQLAMQKGVVIGKAMENLGVLIASTYEQGFIRFGSFFKVYTQAAPEFRRLPSDILKLYVKNDHGQMVPYSAFMRLRKTQGPNEITRYNLYMSAAIQAKPGVGATTNDAIKAIREVAAESLPRGYDIAWEGLSYDEAQRGNEALYIFLVVLAFVYLVLAAQYESFLIPLAVIVSLPAGALGSLALLKGMGLANDIYAQVGMVMLVGLLGKNAVLIVEFAVQEHRRGATVLDAAIAGAKVRFRAILMTSFAFVAGLIPLVIATGAGAIGNRTIGASALGGMLLGTIFGVLVVPGLYYIFGRLSEGRQLIREEYDLPLTEHDDPGDVALAHDYDWPLPAGPAPAAADEAPEAEPAAPSAAPVVAPQTASSPAAAPEPPAPPPAAQPPAAPPAPAAAGPPPPPKAKPPGPPPKPDAERAGRAQGDDDDA